VEDQELGYVFPVSPKAPKQVPGKSNASHQSTKRKTKAR